MRARDAMRALVLVAPVAACTALGIESSAPPRRIDPAPILVSAPATTAAPMPVAAAEEPRCETPCAKAAGECGTMGHALVDSKDPKEVVCARAWLDDACARGEAPACNDIGAMLLVGRGGPADSARARTLLLRACDAKVFMGCINVASTFEREDPARAVAMYIDACDHGAFEGCWLAGDLLAEGRGAAKDPARAAALYDRACEHQIAVACKRTRPVAR